MSAPAAIPTMRLLGTRVSAVLQKERMEAELAEELRFHLMMRARDYVRDGATPEEAARRAGLQFGNINRIKDACRDVSGGGALESLLLDVRFAWRMLKKNRAFNLMAALTLAMAIAANIAVFTVMGSVLLKPLPYPNADHLVAVRSISSSAPDVPQRLSYPDFRDLQAETKTLDGLAAFFPRKFILTQASGELERIFCALVSPEMFPLLGVQPALGRFFLPEEDAPGNRVAIISDEMWRRSFGGRADVLGASVTLDGEPYRIVGVMPPSFRFPMQNTAAQAWLTMAALHEPRKSGGDALTGSRDHHYFHVVGRLKETGALGEADNALKQIANRLAVAHPFTNGLLNSCSVVPWRDHLTRTVSTELMMLTGAALCLLALACANVATLLLAQSATREKESAIRAALGGGRGRILRQLLTESALLGAAAAVLGLLIAAAATPLVVSLLPADFPRADEIAFDGTVFLYTAALAALASCVFAPVPAWRAARALPAAALNDCSRNASEPARRRRFRNALVVVEIGLAFVLLTGAGVFIDGLQRLRQSDPGFNADGIFTARVARQENEAETQERTAAYYAELQQRIRTIPGVHSVSAASHVPFASHRPVTELIGVAKHPSGLPLTQLCTVAPNYFATLQIPFVAGRDFNASDVRDGEGAVILNETLARALFGKDDPIGKRLHPKVSDDERGHIERVVVGVVQDAQSQTGRSRNTPEMYLLHRQFAVKDLALVVRTDIPAETMMEYVRDAAGDIDNSVVSYQPRTLADHIDASIARPRLNSVVLALFAAVGVVVTAIGVYGVVAYSVAQRRHEIGIRLALGAQKPAIFRLVFAHAARLIGAGLLLGSACSIAALPLLGSVTNSSLGTEALIVCAVGTIILLVATAACWIPARRAAAIDPLKALRES